MREGSSVVIVGVRWELVIWSRGEDMVVCRCRKVSEFATLGSL